MKNLLALGDSISIQYEPYLKKAVEGHMDVLARDGITTAQRDLDEAAGANMGDSKKLLEYIQSWRTQTASQVDMLLFNCGLHDLRTDPLSHKKQVPLEQYRQNLIAIGNELNEYSCTCVWITTTPIVDELHNHTGMAFHRYHADVVSYNEIATQVFKGIVTMVDLYQFTKPYGPDAFCDHAHFNEEIRALQGAFIGGFVLGMNTTT